MLGKGTRDRQNVAHSARYGSEGKTTHWADGTNSHVDRAHPVVCELEFDRSDPLLFKMSGRAPVTAAEVTEIPPAVFTSTSQ